MSAKENAPIIIKRVKKGGGDGHHGGAWKVAISQLLQSKGAFAPFVCGHPLGRPKRRSDCCMPEPLPDRAIPVLRMPAQAICTGLNARLTNPAAGH